MSKLFKLIASLLVSFLAGGLGSIVTSANIPSWYASLEKPFFNPPNWVFGPVWTMLYTLMGISLFLVWTARSTKNKKWPAIVFFIQLALNALWSLVFFGLHSPWGGVLVIVPFLITILVTIRLFYPLSKTASWLLVPYALWVTFATTLNVSIALLN